MNVSQNSEIVHKTAESQKQINTPLSDIKQNITEHHQRIVVM